MREKKLSIESIQLLLWPTYFAICWYTDLSFLLAFALSPIPSAPHSLVPLPHAALTSVTCTWVGWGHERRLKPFTLLDQSSWIEGPGKMRRQWLTAERIKHSFYNFFGQMEGLTHLQLLPPSGTEKLHGPNPAEWCFTYSACTRQHSNDVKCDRTDSIVFLVCCVT